MPVKMSLCGMSLIVLGTILLQLNDLSLAQVDVRREVPCCEVAAGRRVVYVGNDTLMTLDRVAAYCAPILWFSPDEPLLDTVEKPSDINIPTVFPFEDPSDDPVVYYRFRSIIRTEELGAYQPADDRSQALIDISQTSGIDLDFFFYYPKEEGLGGHVHDVESIEMKLAILRQPDCEECRYGIVVLNVIGKAHGILWYDNTLEVDEYTKFPIHILVEEGKHASCTDKNGDGYYTPGYDVNKRVNDAWGVRDVMRTGALYTGGFQSWHAKVRQPQDRVFPPLPADSYVRAKWVEDGDYASGYAVYSLRPYPRVQAAKDYLEDPRLVHFVDKGHDNWPEEVSDTGLKDLGRWLEEENFVKSLSIAYRYDGLSGISFVFPLLIVKNVEDPVGGGWLVNRIYLKDKKFRDFSWNILYTTSASRWIDGYFALGWEWDNNGTDTQSHFITETGIKFRGNLAQSPLGFLKNLGTDFWGLRLGFLTWGFSDFDRIGYIVEVGAGTF